MKVFTVLMLIVLNVAGEELVWKSKDELHSHFIKEFVKAPDFGPSRVLMIDTDRFRVLTVDKKKYRVDRMELLSVTDRKKPVLWKLNGGIINQTHLKGGHVKKRDLTSIEKEGFKAIKAGQKFTTAKDNGQLSILGILKAEKSCIRCHKDYKKGELMGAFKYTFFEAGTGLFKYRESPEKDEDKKKKDEKVTEKSVES